MHLILNKIGTKLSVKEGCFYLRHEEGDQSLPPQQLSSIMLQSGSSLTFDAIALAIEHGIDVLFVEQGGFPIGRLWSNRFGSISVIRKQQLQFARSRGAVKWVQKMLLRKLENQALILGMMEGYQQEKSSLLKDAISRLEGYRQKIAEVSLVSLTDAAPTFRGLEGKSGAVFFASVGSCLPDKYQFAKRSQHPALDMFNALLNYAYGILYAKVETALIKAGLDPFIGVFHRDEYNRPVFTYDWIEPYRVWAEYVVIKLCMEYVIFIEFFDIREDGSYWLATDGKRILSRSLYDYLEEVVPLNGLSRSRIHHLEWEITQFAAKLKQMNKAED